MRTVNIMRQYSHPVHSVYNTEKTELHPRANKNSIAIVQKETYLYFSTRKGEIKHTLFFSYGKSRECPINPDRDSRVNIYVHKPD